MCSAFVGIYLFVPVARQAEMLVPAVAVGMGFVYFIYNQHSQETRFFADLFQKFNAKYDSLNSDLNRIASMGDQSFLSRADQQFLFDYFNLCGEEYLYYKTGFIDAEVWVAWRAGMKYFAGRALIRSLWESELKTGSYYGLTMEIIEAVD